jgi:hypothetical protein
MTTSLRIAHLAAAVIGTMSLATLVACAPAAPEYPAARLAGNVRIGGEPITAGRVHFMPTAGTAGVPVTAEISAGQYVAEGVPLGSNVVTFSAVKETGKAVQEPGREPYPEFASIIPAKYSQGIPLHVAGDNETQDFDLTTDRP